MINVPPHEPMYQFQFAPVPRLPPDLDKVDGNPWQTGEFAEADKAGDDKVLTVITTLKQSVVLQIPEARIKYVVVTVWEMTWFEPENRYEPLQVPAYHNQFAPVPKIPPICESVDWEPEHITIGLEIAVAGGDEIVFISTKIEEGTPFPQEFEGVNIIFPGILPIIYIIEFEVLEPVQPDGVVQLYKIPVVMGTE
jgi:hypothetical protein